MKRVLRRAAGVHVNRNWQRQMDIPFKHFVLQIQLRTHTKSDFRPVQPTKKRGGSDEQGCVAECIEEREKRAAGTKRRFIVRRVCIVAREPAGDDPVD